MNKLFIDTSSATLSLGLKSEDFEYKFEGDEYQNKISENVLPEIVNLCDKAKITFKDIDEIFVTKGPGSYTGERIGLTIAKTLYVLNNNVIIHEISTLKAMSLDKKQILSICLLDARNKAYFSGIYLEEKEVKEESREEHVDVVKEIDNNSRIVLLKTQKYLESNFDSFVGKIEYVDLLSNMMNNENSYEIPSEPLKMKALYLRGKDERN